VSAEAEPQGERLQKVLARAGLGSRRACEELVADGRVTVNGAVAVLGQRVDPRSDAVAVDGVPVPVAPDLVYYLLNKPPGVVSTASDPEGRPTVVSLVPETPRVFSVGRLDYDTEGLLILTNDGELANRLSHPSRGVAKEYLAEVAGAVGPGAMRRLRDGVELTDGRTAPATVGQPSPGVLRIVIHEGRNRQVRRMCDAVGHPVRRLVRTRIGPVTDPSLRPGAWRMLTGSEVRALYAASVAASGAAGRATGSDRRRPAAGRQGSRPAAGRQGSRNAAPGASRPDRGAR
jgi:23S rRNA pseudouridine2605 synthase